MTRNPPRMQGMGRTTEIRRTPPLEAYMTEQKKPLSEYLVISRGQWDKDKSREEIQNAIDKFYVWHDGLVNEGRMKAGQRLATERKIVSKQMVTDGPFAETKEVIGGYWFILASSLEEAAELAAENPCLACGLTYEIRPIEPERASAYKVTNETPGATTLKLKSALSGTESKRESDRP